MDSAFQKTKKLKKLEKTRAKDVNYFEGNYENMVYTTKSTDWSKNFEYEFQLHPMYPNLHFMFKLDSRMRVNLRKKTQSLCSNTVRLSTRKSTTPIKSRLL